MKIFPTILVLLIWFTAFHTAEAQYNRSRKHWEIGGRLGLVNYSGDLAEDHIMLSQTSWGLGAFVRLHLSQQLFLRGEISTARLYGDDKHSPSHAWRKFEFTNQIWDGSMLLEFAPFRFKRDPVGGRASHYFHIYSFAGPSLVYSKPRVGYYGLAEDLDRYTVTNFPEDGTRSRMFISTVLGQGVRMIYGDYYCLSLEASIHPVFNDLLDGVSLNGNPDANDWFYKAAVTFSYFFNRPYKPALGEY
jgi:hypothetical protein